VDKLILAIHFFACFLIIVLILLQSGKGSANGIFGGSGGGDTLFSASSGANFIKRFTMGLAATIAITSLMLSIFVTRSKMSSVTDKFDNVPFTETQADKAPAKAEK
jgi:preprotein translocase subunit SecG